MSLVPGHWRNEEPAWVRIDDKWQIQGERDKCLDLFADNSSTWRRSHAQALHKQHEVG